MQVITLEKISHIDKKVLENMEMEKLEISNSTLSLPTEISQLKNLKELRLINNQINHIPASLLQLTKTFVFFEGNKPAYNQQIGQIIFDLQWNKISLRQAEVYLHLIQSDFNQLKETPLELIISGLDYHLKEVRSAALNQLNELLPLSAPITEKSKLAIIGQPTLFAFADIDHRMKNVQVLYDNKLSKQVTHVILCEQPKLNGITKDIIKLPLSTELHFKQWLDAADEQFLAKKTAENTGALENVIEMLLSYQPDNVDMALQIMKTHGVSKELLTALFIYFMDSKDKGRKRKTNNLFKKHAPKELLNYLENNSYNIASNHKDFYGFIAKGAYMDPLKIAFYRNKQAYFEFLDTEKRKEYLNAALVNDVLDFSTLGLNKIPEEVKELGYIQVLLCNRKQDSGTSLWDLPDWIDELKLEKLDLNGQYLNKLPESITKLHSLAHLILPKWLYFPDPVVFKIPNLEILEMDQHLFESLPEEIRQMKKLKHLVVHISLRFKKKIIEEKKAFLPEGCEIVIKNREY